MKTISRLGALSLLAASAAAQASPFTFQFDLPDWTSNNGPALFGTNAVLDVTVDNGTSSDLGQSYLNSQITQVQLTAVGGTFSDTWNDSDYGTNTALSQSYVSTNASGTPTLDLLPSSVTSAMDWQDSAGLIQLGVITPGGGASTLQVGNSSGSAGYVPYTGSFPLPVYQGFEGTGTLTGSVPEPPTLALFGLGLAGIALTRRRVRAR